MRRWQNFCLRYVFYLSIFYILAIRFEVNRKTFNSVPAAQFLFIEDSFWNKVLERASQKTVVPLFLSCQCGILSNMQLCLAKTNNVSLQNDLNMSIVKEWGSSLAPCVKLYEYVLARTQTFDSYGTFGYIILMTLAIVWVLLPYSFDLWS